ncbi:MAG: hypothetical protein ACMUJM_05235 [bacterium]
MFKGRKFLILLFFLLIACAIIFPLSVRAQYWAAIPPYNVMWPLWSPALSPADPVTGVASPIVTTLTKNTVLPVQPGLAWDPCQPDVEAFPWLLYNIPPTLGGGLVYWDVYYGLNPWPPNYTLDPVTGAPSPITLPLGWSLLSPISLSHFDWFVPLGNSIFGYQYGVPLSSLLTTAEIWGLPPLASLPAPII